MRRRDGNDHKGRRGNREEVAMSTKQFLYSIRDEYKEIEELEMRIEELETSLLPQGIRYDKELVQTSPADTATDLMAEIGDYQVMLRRKLMKLNRRRKTAQEKIDTLTDSRQRQILDLYFLSDRRYTMAEVAAVMGYSTKQTFRMYSWALEKMSVNDSEQCGNMKG